MTAYPRIIRIAPREMQILRLLLQHGPASVRELHRHLANLAYTTVLTICVRLAEKGLLERQRARRATHPLRIWCGIGAGSPAGG